MFNEQDLANISKRGMTPAQIEIQINHFKKGFPFIDLVAAATLEHGIIAPASEEAERLIKLYEHEAHHLKCIKFVPASGAASRMFSHLFVFKEALQQEGQDAKTLLEKPAHKLAKEFFEGLTQFAFYPELLAALKNNGQDLSNCLKNADFIPILDALLTDRGLSYANLPKGLLSFHSYGEEVRKAVEEHLVEGAMYCSSEQKEVHLHFTLSPEHIKLFEKLMQQVIPVHEKKYGVSFHITHSIQQSDTDMIAVDTDNNPFREADGSLLFRPGGHGALLSNLEELDADIIFIKNIDNIVHDRLKTATVESKKLLGGLLVEVRNAVHTFVEQLEDANLTQADLNKIRDFCVKKLMIKLPAEYGQFDIMEQIDYLYTRLNRPIRVCGMVKNEGEPGGGPFWVKDADGDISLQIVESSQVNINNVEQSDRFKKATHFNPVDLVCCIKDYSGNTFELQEFLDPQTGFISTKTKDGRNLKAQELPGLWNGSMAYWLTLFVEVPISTFNPVKTVNDLLREGHWGKQEK